MTVVDLWWADLLGNGQELDRLAECLSPEERERAARLSCGAVRRRFIVGRSLLRVLLGRQLGRAPAAVLFTYGEHGKPALFGRGRLRFSVSHSGELCLYALSELHDVGVDVELLRSVPYARLLADRDFARAEAASLRGLGGRALDEAFLACWTRKEAYLKARGDGLRLPLDSFDALGTAVESDEPEARTFSLSPFVPCQGYVATVAVEGLAVVIRERGEIAS